MTLRDKINNAVDEARNCRRLSYKALDLLEELFNAELKSVAGAYKKPRCIYAVMFHSTGADFETSVELFSSLEFAAQCVARDACQVMNAYNIPTDTPYEAIAKPAAASAVSSKPPYLFRENRCNSGRAASTMPPL